MTSQRIWLIPIHWWLAWKLVQGISLIQCALIVLGILLNDEILHRCLSG